MKKVTGSKVLKNVVCLPTRQYSMDISSMAFLLIHLSPVQPRVGEWFSYCLHYQTAWGLCQGSVSSPSNAVGAEFTNS